MHINQDNYEQYFLDHAEGNLIPGMEKELADFLEANPDLRPVLDEFDTSPLPPSDIVNESLKIKLRRAVRSTNLISEDNIDEWLIMEAEEQLSESEAGELKEFISFNPAYAYDRKLYGHARLLPDLSIVFSGKNALRKKAKLLIFSQLAWAVPAVAAVILIFFVIRIFLSHKTVNMPQVFIIETPSQTHETPSQTHETPSQTHETPSQFSRPYPFRLRPSGAKAIIVPNPYETKVMNMIAYEIPPTDVAQKKEKPLIAKIFRNMIAKARDGISGLSKPDRVRKTDFNFWSSGKSGDCGI